MHLLFPRQSLFFTKRCCSKDIDDFLYLFGISHAWQPCWSSGSGQASVYPETRRVQRARAGALLPFVVWRPSVSHMQGMSEVSWQMNRATSFVRG